MSLGWIGAIRPLLVDLLDVEKAKLAEMRAARALQSIILTGRTNHFDDGEFVQIQEAADRRTAKVLEPEGGDA